jgi:hypothetical protein
LDFQGPEGSEASTQKEHFIKQSLIDSFKVFALFVPVQAYEIPTQTRREL